MSNEVERAVTDRLSVILIPDAAQALGNVQERTGLKKVDIVNRALALYEFIDGEVRAGNEVVLRDDNGREQRVKIFF